MMGIGLAHYMSRRSRAQTGATEETFLGEDKEWLIIYSKEVLQQKKVDFFVFGHRHLPVDYRLSTPLSTEGRGVGGEARYINLGDWIRYFTYAVFDGEEMKLVSYTGKDEKIIRN
jgi:UDP-2,3-diacylglucosamine hydrolase